MKMPRNNRRKYIKDRSEEKKEAAVKEEEVIEIKDNFTENGGKDDE